ncbi:helix-turn-helix domain-containing protein [Rhizobiaceae bacterium n13]|uniref:Helix-turn-helix domain-containing protein n=1 Tax=Ferirhizobium litorale TaxID=2927786 RepID=A0AAE3U5U8_9HYPH|nr:helix-turn-helix domain-containing protein [Fererhizobium litorale]MDI7864113.1 helix-turn-helix domain-containing protein [Fererhizobium litorale]MDI7924434.1 helix-turn-helix domain-containing protein [Fererhizobium litorale]
MSTKHLIVKAARTALGLSRKELADLAGLSDRTIYNIETAQDYVLIDTMMKVRSVFRNHGIELVEGDGNRGWGLFFISDDPRPGREP